MRGLAAYSLALLLLPSVLFGQTVKRDLPELEFARFDRNRIEFPGDSSSFESLFNKMDAVLFEGAGNLRIMQIGGSHVQAGTLTRQFRNNLLALGEELDGGRGLVFPFSAAKTNNPSSFRTRYEGDWTVTRNVSRTPDKKLGLTGMAITTSDSTAFIRIVLKARNATSMDPSFSFDKVDVLGYSPDGGRSPLVVLESGDTLRGIRDEARSLWSFNLPESRDSVTVAVGKGSGELTLTGLFLDNSKPGISVTGIGVNGAAIPSYLHCEDFERDLRLVNPDLVIFAIGINDAVGKDFSKQEFIRRYKSLVTRVRAVNPGCALLFETNNDSFRRVRRRVYSVNRNGLEVEDAFFTLGADCGAGVWDLFDIMGGLGSMEEWEKAGLAKKDKIHFTEEGYALAGDLLFNALMAKYVDHLRRRLSWD